jgi:hypothetical protein
MNTLYSIVLAVPLAENSLLLLSSTLALVFGRIKLALLINYCFTLYWGYFLNVDIITEYGLTDTFTYMYFGFGLAILLLALVGFIFQRD